MINLFAFRTRSPKKLRAATDPVGPDNDRWTDARMVAASMNTVGPVIAAWGAHPGITQRVEYVVAAARRCGIQLQCLGTTANGSPRHPLYLPADTPLEPFRPLS